MIMCLGSILFDHQVVSHGGRILGSNSSSRRLFMMLTWNNACVARNHRLSDLVKGLLVASLESFESVSLELTDILERLLLVVNLFTIMPRSVSGGDQRWFRWSQIQVLGWRPAARIVYWKKFGLLLYIWTWTDRLRCQLIEALHL